MDPCMLGDILGSPAHSYFRGSELQSSITVVSGRESFSNFHLPTAKDGVNLWSERRGTRRTGLKSKALGLQSLDMRGRMAAKDAAPALASDTSQNQKTELCKYQVAFLPHPHAPPHEQWRGATTGLSQQSPEIPVSHTAILFSSRSLPDGPQSSPPVPWSWPQP